MLHEQYGKATHFCSSLEKFSKIRFVYKSEDKEELGNYKPFSVVLTIKLMKNHLQSIIFGKKTKRFV